MLINETIEKLKSMRLPGFVEALEEQNDFSSFQELSFEERLGLLVDREFSKRKSNRIQRLIQQAKFQDPTACIENIHYGAERKMNKQAESIFKIMCLSDSPEGDSYIAR